MKITNVTRFLKDSPRSNLTGVDVNALKEDMKADSESKLVPTNEHILDRASKYKKQMPMLLKGLEVFRDELLEKVYPAAFSVSNGLADSERSKW